MTLSSLIYVMLREGCGGVGVWGCGGVGVWGCGVWGCGGGGGGGGQGGLLDRSRNAIAKCCEELIK